MPKNYFRIGEWLPIETLAPDYRGPILLADETQTIQWHPEEGSRAPVTHTEHVRDEASNTFFYDEDKPRMQSRKVKPAFWALANVVGE